MMTELKQYHRRTLFTWVISRYRSDSIPKRELLLGYFHAGRGGRAR